MAESFTANVGDATGFCTAEQRCLTSASRSRARRQSVGRISSVQQGAQMQLDMAGADQVRQAAAGILSSSNDEGVRAQLYPRVVGLLQSQGLAKSAPAQYPGEATLRALVNSGLSAKDLYASGALLTPQQQQAFNTPTSPAGGGGGTELACGWWWTCAIRGGEPAARRDAGRGPAGSNGLRRGERRARRRSAGWGAVSSRRGCRRVAKASADTTVFLAPNMFGGVVGPGKTVPQHGGAQSDVDPQYQAILNNVVRPVMSGQTQDPTGGCHLFLQSEAPKGQLGRGDARLCPGQSDDDRQSYVLLWPLWRARRHSDSQRRTACGRSWRCASTASTQSVRRPRRPSRGRGATHCGASPGARARR